MNNSTQLLQHAQKVLRMYELPALEARLLLAYVLHRSPEWLIAHPEHVISVWQKIRFIRLLRKRKKGIANAYLIGKKEFWGRSFKVRPPVHIPRPDTETMIATIVESHYRNNSFTVHDVCTGSGCIAITIALECPYAQVSASDISMLALRTAKKNNKRWGHPLVYLKRSNFLNKIKGKFDVITANPPYLSQNEWEQIKHCGESHNALVAPENGYAAYKIITRQAIAHLKDKGMLIYEIGHTQTDIIQNYMQQAGFNNIEVIKDLGGRPRIIKGIYFSEEI